MLAFALAAVELGMLLRPAPIRVAAGLILFVLPGVTITRAIQTGSRRDGRDLLLLAPSLSLPVALITGLILNGAEIRLTAVHWAVALGLVTVAGLVAETMLEEQNDVGQHARGRLRFTAKSSGGQGIPPVAVFVIAALAVSAAVVIDVLGQSDHDRNAAFTQVWALPVPGSPPVAELGVRSHERAEVRYSIRVSIDGRLVRTEALALRPGQTWQSLQLIGRSGDEVDVALIALPQRRIYREVHLTTA